MQKNKIKIIKAQTLKGGHNGLSCLLGLKLSEPDLRRNKKILALNTAAPDALADIKLIAVCRSRINKMIADLDRVGDGFGADLGIGYLIRTEADHRHFNTVVESDSFFDHFSIRGSFKHCRNLLFENFRLSL